MLVFKVHTPQCDPSLYGTWVSESLSEFQPQWVESNWLCHTLMILFSQQFFTFVSSLRVFLLHFSFSLLLSLSLYSSIFGSFLVGVQSYMSNLSILLMFQKQNYTWCDVKVKKTISYTKLCFELYTNVTKATQDQQDKKWR